MSENEINRHPPHVSVEYRTPGAKSDDTVQPGQPSSPPTEVDQESGAEMEGTELVSPPTGQVPSIPAQAGPEIGNQEVIVRGVAAITMAHMLEMDTLWDMETGDPVSIDVARTIPERVFIDFNALREHTEQLEPDTVAELIAALPEPGPQRVNVAETAQKAFTKGAAGPGVTVKHIPGLVRVEVSGPVTLQKSKQGETRILQVKYKTVEAPTGHAGVTPQPVQVKRAHIQNPHQVTTRRHQAKRTVPRIPPPVSEAPPPKEEPVPDPEQQIDDDYTF
jgi:hypothetical protein